MPNSNLYISFRQLCWKAIKVLVLGLTLMPRISSAADPMQTSTNKMPQLFLIGDSIVKTGTPPGDTGPWGWGYELAPLFNAEKIQVHNEGRGGRSSRSYIEEGVWATMREQLAPGDFVIIHFGHNDAKNSQNYPDRTTVAGNGDEAQEIESPVTHKKEMIHSYGWYLRQYVKDIQAKGATAIICSSVPRDTWTDGKIKRGFDGYAGWAAEAAKNSGALFLDLNTLAAKRFDALGQEQMTKYFADNQHTTKAGAQLNAGAIVEGLKGLTGCPLAGFLKGYH